jgi:hypothetical protein
MVRTAVFRHASQRGGTRYQLRRGQQLLGMRINETVFEGTSNDFELLDIPSFARNTRTGQIYPFNQFLDRIKEPLCAFVVEMFRRFQGTAWTMQLVVFVFYTRDELVVHPETPRRREWKTAKTVAYHLSEMMPVRNPDHFRNVVWPVMRDKVIEGQHNYVHNGSDWRYNYPTAVILKANQFNPIGRGKGGRRRQQRGRIRHPLPRKLTERRCLVNVQNRDNECFRYAVLSCLACAATSAIRSHRNRPTGYDAPSVRGLADFSMMKYPVGIGQLDEFERGNAGLAVNVYVYEEDADVFVKQRVSTRVHLDNVRVVNLLLYKQHYMWISHLSRMLHASRRTRKRIFPCPACDKECTSASALQKHTRACRHREAYDMEPEIKMPRVGVNDRLRFTDYSKCLLVPVVIYADCESILEPEQNADERMDNESEEAHQFAINKHVPCSVGMKLVCTLDDTRTRSTVIHFGKDCIAAFLDTLKEYEKLVASWYDNPVPMTQLTPAETDAFNTSSQCVLCNQTLDAPPPEDIDRFRYLSEECKSNVANWTRCHDHCHFTGHYRGAAHCWCNLQAKSTYKIPVIMHNFRGYDSHLILSAGDFTEFKRIRCIAYTMEKYMCVDFSRFRFLDSIQFLDESLDVLVQLRRDVVTERYKEKQEQHDDEDVVASVFPLLASEFAHVPMWKRDLLLRKGVYPYEWVTCWEKFDTATIPPRSAFRSRLRGDYLTDDGGISELEYTHAENVWQTFGMKTFRNYHDLYLKTDVLLLADVFEAFRRMCHQEFKIDPAHCLSSANLTWQCMLKFTGVSIPLVTDLEMYEMLHGSLRGGMCFVSKRLSFAKNPHTIPQRSADNPDNSWIIYLDANNLYGAAMMMRLPYGDYEWMPEWKIRLLFNRRQTLEELKDAYTLPHCTDDLDYRKVCEWLMEQREDQDKGYVLEVDLEYPDEIHDTMNDYPVAVERKEVWYTELSDAQVELFEQNYGPRAKYTAYKTKKLLPTLEKKRNYAVHYLNLQLYVKLGVRVTCVHRVLQYSQSAWLAPYVVHNTKMRAAAKNGFEKKFRKGMINALYGKTVENVRNRREISLCNNRSALKRKCDSPLLKGIRIFNETLVAVEMQKSSVLINKPTAVGFSVLELSKLLMYRFHYEIMKPRYSKLQLLMTDTDSLVYEVHTANVYKDMYEMREHFDFSEYARTSPFYSDENKLVVGKMKDEYKGVVIKSFVGLAPKMYSILTVENKEKKTAKGVPRSTLAKTITHTDYETQVTNPTVTRVFGYSIASANHKVYTVHKTRRGICSFDNKRWIAANGVDTYAYGHARLRTAERDDNDNVMQSNNKVVKVNRAPLGNVTNT